MQFTSLLDMAREISGLKVTLLMSLISCSLAFTDMFPRKHKNRWLLVLKCLHTMNMQISHIYTEAIKLLIKWLLMELIDKKLLGGSPPPLSAQSLLRTTKRDYPLIDFVRSFLPYTLLEIVDYTTVFYRRVKFTRRFTNRRVIQCRGR